MLLWRARDLTLLVSFKRQVETRFQVVSFKRGFEQSRARKGAVQFGSDHIPMAVPAH